MRILIDSLRETLPIDMPPFLHILTQEESLDEEQAWRSLIICRFGDKYTFHKRTPTSFRGGEVKRPAPAADAPVDGSHSLPFYFLDEIMLFLEIGKKSAGVAFKTAQERKIAYPGISDREVCIAACMPAWHPMHCSLTLRPASSSTKQALDTRQCWLSGGLGARISAQKLLEH